MSKAKLKTQMVDLKGLQRRLGYTFSDDSLLVRALTHRSYSKDNYERLEFLGDSFLGWVISDCLFEQFPQQPEGILTRLRANIVRQKSLADVAKEFELNRYLLLGSGECKAGGQNRDSILSDCLEAIIAAIYFDAGEVRARTFVETVFKARMMALDPNIQLKDPKSLLQEWLQQRGHDLPLYEVVSITGKDHNQTFEMACEIAMIDHRFQAKNTSRRKAEQATAQQILDYISDKGIS